MRNGDKGSAGGGATRGIVNAALSSMRGDFEDLYASRKGRPSIPPEVLLPAMLLQALY